MSFFTPGEFTDPAYGLNRDDENRADLKREIERLWEEFHHLVGDSQDHFRQLAKTNFQGVVWHLYLLACCRDIGLNLQRPNEDQPDIKIDLGNNRTLWIEAISMTSGNGADAAPEPPWGTVFRPAERQIILRHTSGVQSKAAKFQLYAQKGIVKPNDVSVIALNVGCVEGFLHTETGVTYLEQSVLGLGEQFMTISVDSGEVTGHGHHEQPNVSRANGAPVETTFFLNQESSHISAILYSTDHIVNCYRRRTRDLILLHNPMSTNSLPRGLFNVGIEKWVADNHLHFQNWRGDPHES